MTVWGKLIANADIVDPLIFGRQISAYSALWKYMKDEPEMISMISKVLPQVLRAQLIIGVEGN